ncbi:conserved hypothetical protein [Bradyrhizobium sp. STM 3843]|uniref:hypothetical protein n=1 Tax=Bradyrhizobium sp. STM 3843 TaxID=551947 RepID=UPI000240556E|nr:hypothetical protein [Bradyrhizobium sp. STM 3843]CCE09404.1 conserved hypothetical protein [Bradyrhizobium sp. STM 3843]
MGERTTYGRSHDRVSGGPEYSSYPEETAQERPGVYRFGRSSQDTYPSDDSMPMFLSDYDDEHDGAGLPYEEHWPARPRRASLSSRILLAVVAAAGVAMLFALVTSDATRDLIATAKASIIGAPTDPTAPPQPADTQLTARDLQLNEPARLPPSQAPVSTPVQTASVAPSREDIANAYQAALQNRAVVEPVVAAAPPAPVAPPPAASAPVVTAPNSITAPGAATAIVAPAIVGPSVTAPMQSQQPRARRMDADELAGIMKRARSLLAAGDIPAARLLLERAADAQEAGAALMLAQTYDVQVLGTSDVRNINADPTAARTWYRRAAQLGSAEAQRRLDQLQN